MTNYSIKSLFLCWFSVLCFAICGASEPPAPDSLPALKEASTCTALALWQRHVGYAGLSLMASSVVVKEAQEVFPSARTRQGDGLRTKADNYLRFAPYPVMAALNLSGYRGRSDWTRLGVQTLTANALMALAVEASKRTIHATRPDASDRRSFPSGHTATAFVAASILHKEYGETRSPWFSVGGYAVASATALMRVVNNRHSAADVMAGAGIGIFSTELGYFLTDLWMKNKGLNHLPRQAYDASGANFVSLTMGVATAPSRITFAESAGASHSLRLGTATTIGVEGAHFFNPWVGVGMQARIMSTPVSDAVFSAEELQQVQGINRLLATYSDAQNLPLPGIYGYDVTDNQLLSTSLSAGVCGQLPISSRFSIGAKALMGVRFSDGVTFKARNGVPKAETTQIGTAYWMEDAEGNSWLAADVVPGIDCPYNSVLDHATEPFHLLRVKGSTSMNYVLGVSIVWRYRQNMAWKLFADFDTASTRYTWQSRLFSDEALARIAASPLPAAHPSWLPRFATIQSTTTKKMHHICLGATLTISL